MECVVRAARTKDVSAVRQLVDVYAADRRLLSKSTVVLYEDVQEFVVAELDGRVVGCGALHVMWEDLAEVRTLAVDPSRRGRGIGARILEQLMARARDLGVERVVCLTFETAFFARHGFAAVPDVAFDPDLRQELLQSPDEGIAEFLDLPRARPNTLGNTRMLARLG